MKFAKADQVTNELFNKISPVASQEVEAKKMFGFPCRFINGQMFMGVYGKQIILRLPETERQKFLQEYDSEIFSPVPGRTMKEYVVIPPKVLKNKKSLVNWITVSAQYVKTLPKKIKKKK